MRLCSVSAGSRPGVAPHSQVGLVDNDCIMLVASATTAKWKSTKAAIAETVTSFVALPVLDHLRNAPSPSPLL